MFTAFIVKRHEINGKETDGQARIEMSPYTKPLEEIIFLIFQRIKLQLYFLFY